MPLEEAIIYAETPVGANDNTAQPKAGMAELTRRQAQSKIDAAELAKRNARYMRWPILILAILSGATLAVTIGLAIWKS